MGWTYMVKPRESTSEWFKNTLTWTSEAGAVTRPLAVAIVARKEAYAAVETIRPDGSREVWAAVFLLDFKPSARDGLTFGYKDMDESMGPNANRCPAKILDLLTPTDREYANAWRERCRERLALIEHNKLAHGDVIKLDRHLNYQGYGEYDTFRANIRDGKTLFWALEPETLTAKFLCRITNWREERFEKIDPEEALALRSSSPRF